MEQFNHYFLDTLKNRYADFRGRATRSEFWYFTLFYVIIAIILQLLDAKVLNPMLGMTAEQAMQGGILQILFALALIIPSIAVGVRRLHDIGKSGWWMLLALVPVIGILILIFLFVQESK